MDKKFFISICLSLFIISFYAIIAYYPINFINNFKNFSQVERENALASIFGFCVSIYFIYGYKQKF